MNELEFLREAFKDRRLHIGIGTIKKFGLANDKSKLRVQVSLLPENREIVAEMSFPDTTVVNFPELDDLVLVEFVDGHPDEAYVTRVLNTKQEPLPKFSVAGHLCVGARPGKKSYLSSDIKVGIARTGSEPAEPLVLGTVAVSGLNALIDAFLTATQIGSGAAGAVFLDPSVRQALLTFRQTFLTDAGTNILSQIGFTERGQE